MARSKAKVYACCALMLLCVVSVIVCIIVFTRVSPVKCPGDTFSHAAVAADSERCSQIGRDMLKRGGSAVDGAIAALLCTSIMNPQSMGIGGGSIFTVMDSSGNVKIINSRETVPKNFKRDLLQLCPETFQMTTGNVKIINSRETVPRNLSGDLLLLLCPKAFQMTTGSHWIGVPGEIRGYEKAHRMYGKLPWADLFQPTIKLAREGFPVPPVQGCFIPYIDSNATQKLRELFSDQSGNLLKAGDTVKFEKLADTLEVIAEKGADEFYSGRIAQDLISDIQEAGGTLTAEDLAEYAVTVTDAWAVPLGEYQMYIPPPPAGGTVLSFILNILKGYQLSPASLSGENKTLAYHRYIEAFKFANGLKKHIGDPKFVSEKLAKKFTTDSFADHIRSLIRDKTLDPEIYNITPSVGGVGTTHL